MDPDDTLPIAFLPQDAHRCPGRLGFCPAPGLFADYVLRPRDLVPTELACLRDRCGASVLVTLLEEEEMSEIGLDGLLASVRDAGLESVPEQWVVGRRVDNSMASMRRVRKRRMSSLRLSRRSISLIEAGLASRPRSM